MADKLAEFAAENGDSESLSSKTELVELSSEWSAAQERLADNFKSAFREHPAGVGLVTADDGSGPVALTASSIASVSVTPPLLIFSVSTLSSSYGVVSNVDTLVIHLLDSSEIDLAKLGATSGIDRFADETKWRRSSHGEPYFHEAKRRITGKVVHRWSVGMSCVLLVEAINVDIDNDQGESDPLVYHHHRWHKLTDGSLIVD